MTEREIDTAENAEHVAHPRDVRAGPGDAGAADRPSHLPETAADRRAGRSATRLFLGLLLLGVLVAMVLGWAAMN